MNNLKHKKKTISAETREKISKKLQGRKISDETRNKMSIAASGKNNSMYGISSPMKGKHHSCESRLKISLSKKGKFVGKDNPFYGKKHTLSTKIKLSNIAKGKYCGKNNPMYGKSPFKGKKHSDETKKKMRESRSKQIFPVKDSSIERKLHIYLNAINIDYVKHMYIKIKHAYQCDIYIPKLNLIIEADGNYWHNYPIGREIDHIRTEELKEKGHNVLRLWESEINNMDYIDLYNIIRKSIYE